jgi:hypothetical protein
MKDWKAIPFICDEVTYSLTGKVFAQGIYTGDLSIPSDEFTIPQLVFFFLIEGPADTLFKSITLKVLLPGQPPATMEVPLSIPAKRDPRRTRMSLKSPFLILQPVLRPGRIETKVVHVEGEIDAGGQWIVTQRLEST